jgi:hypothetical protein
MSKIALLRRERKREREREMPNLRNGHVLRAFADDDVTKETQFMRPH